MLKRESLVQMLIVVTVLAIFATIYAIGSQEAQKTRKQSGEKGDQTEQFFSIEETSPGSGIFLYRDRCHNQYVLGDHLAFCLDKLYKEHPEFNPIEKNDILPVISNGGYCYSVIVFPKAVRKLEKPDNKSQ